MIELKRLGSTHLPVLNILDDVADERTLLEATQKALLNILEDSAEEKARVINVELRWANGRPGRQTVSWRLSVIRSPTICAPRCAASTGSAPPSSRTTPTSSMTRARFISAMCASRRR